MPTFLQESGRRTCDAHALKSHDCSLECQNFYGFEAVPRVWELCSLQLWGAMPFPSIQPCLVPPAFATSFLALFFYLRYPLPLPGPFGCLLSVPLDSCRGGMPCQAGSLPGARQASERRRFCLALHSRSEEAGPQDSQQPSVLMNMIINKCTRWGGAQGCLQGGTSLAQRDGDQDVVGRD